MMRFGVEEAVVVGLVVVFMFQFLLDDLIYCLWGWIVRSVRVLYGVV
jgi:hypothetical protein